MCPYCCRNPWSRSDRPLCPISQERAQRSKDAKNRGNQLYQQRRFAEAIDAYTEVGFQSLPRPARTLIDLRSCSRLLPQTRKKLFTTATGQVRSFCRWRRGQGLTAPVLACYTNLGRLDECIADCNEALKLNPMYLKALGRRAVAFEKKQDWYNALVDYTAMCIIEEFKVDATVQSTDRILKEVAKQKSEEIMKARTTDKQLPSSVFISAYLDSFRKCWFYPGGHDQLFEAYFMELSLSLFRGWS